MIIAKYFIYLIIYSFIGWVIEVTWKLISEKRFINRGFLIGPVCPIYGFGVLFIIMIIRNTSDLLSVFLKSILICSLLEYYTSYFMEKIFNARWWDYSKSKYNINGRICLNTMIPFGILGSLVVCVVHPYISLIVYSLGNNLIIVSIILFIIFITDFIISFNVLKKIKNQIVKQAEDSTELIRKKVLKWMESNSVLIRHIKEAYPKFRIFKRVSK